MSGYIVIIAVFWVLIIALVNLFKLKIIPKDKIKSYLLTLVFIFVIPGFLIDLVALKFQWYIFPATTKYFWITPVGVPIEEVLFFLTVPVWIIVLWKLVQTEVR